MQDTAQAIPQGQIVKCPSADFAPNSISEVPHLPALPPGAAVTPHLAERKA